MTLDLFDGEFQNPFRPGAGHMPPYLAGRELEQNEFKHLLTQTSILENMVLTGLRGVGKTVLLEKLKPIAIDRQWFWVGTDLTESTSISEDSMARRLLTDLSVITSSIVIDIESAKKIGFNEIPLHSDDLPYRPGSQDVTERTLDYRTLASIYEITPGLVLDKIKRVLEVAWAYVSTTQCKGIIFAYDEAQNLADHAKEKEYPLSLMLDVFQSIQRKDIPFMLVLTGLPTLYPKLVAARTFSERMFHVVELGKLTEKESRDAILLPIRKEGCPVKFDDKSVGIVSSTSGGYPYFIQFICREVYDVFIQRMSAGQKPSVPIQEIVNKLDSDFFAGRWARATDRQRELLRVIATLDGCEGEFTTQDVVRASKITLDKPFGSSHANQMLTALCANGLLYKNRHGKYSFAVPLLGDFIMRQEVSSPL